MGVRWYYAVCPLNAGWPDCPHRTSSMIWSIFLSLVWLYTPRNAPHLGMKWDITQPDAFREVIQEQTPEWINEKSDSPWPFMCSSGETDSISSTGFQFSCCYSTPSHYKQHSGGKLGFSFYHQIYTAPWFQKHANISILTDPQWERGFKYPNACTWILLQDWCSWLSHYCATEGGRLS